MGFKNPWKYSALAWSIRRSQSRSPSLVSNTMKTKKCDENVRGNPVDVSEPTLEQLLEAVNQNDVFQTTSAVQGCKQDLGTFLRDWSIKHKITHQALKPLLEQLVEYHRQLPVDPRRLLRAPRYKPVVKVIDGGSYWHHSIDFTIDGNGLIINHHKLTINIRSIICDAPARAFVKGVTNFNAIHECLKCCTISEYSKELRTTVFPQTVAECRTDRGFRDRLYGKHHQEYVQRRDGKLTRTPIETPFLKIPIDMIEEFIVSDSLHLLHLGVMKKLLMTYRDGHCNVPKWSKGTVQELSKALDLIKLPMEIHRYIPVAKILFKEFIATFDTHFGSVTSNTHNLVHVVEEVEKKGPLSSISTYPNTVTYLMDGSIQYRIGENPQFTTQQI